MNNINTKEIEYVYTLHQWDCSWLPDSWTEHPVIKKSAKFVYVAWMGRKDNILHLNRQELEQTGETFHRMRETFYTEAGKAEYESQHSEMSTPDCLKELGLARLATVQDVKGAYRQLAQQRHPDAGGKHEDFIKLQAAYEAAIKIAM